MIEYGTMDTKRMKFDEIEEKLTSLSRKGWKVKCAFGSYGLILFRKVKISEE